MPRAAAVSISRNDNLAGDSNLIATSNAMGAFAFLSASSLDAARDHKGSENGHAVKVSSAGSTTGVALVELYQLP